METPTLNAVFAWQEEAVSSSKRRKLERRDRLRKIRKTIEAERLPGLWRSTRDEILRNVENLLDVSMLEVFRRAWNTTRQLTRYRDREKYPPDKTFVVPLAEHKITSRHAPYLEVRVNQKPAGRIDFEILVEFALKGLRLHIRDGRIRTIDTGECQAKGKLSCEGFVLAQRESKKLELPGTIDLGDGIEI